jgi:hypothetical protein
MRVPTHCPWAFLWRRASRVRSPMASLSHWATDIMTLSTRRPAAVAVSSDSLTETSATPVCSNCSSRSARSRTECVSRSSLASLPSRCRKEASAWESYDELALLRAPAWVRRIARPLRRVIRDSPKSAPRVFGAATAISTLSTIDTPFRRTVGSPAFGKPQPAPHRQARTGGADFPRAEAGRRSGVPMPVRQRSFRLTMDLPPEGGSHKERDRWWYASGP